MVYEVHELLAEAGWIACDFYDGSLIYDFGAGQLSVIDLDSYHRGSFHNDMGRTFGSTRFMAPEEFELGAPIDQRTTVFTLGRTALVLLSDGTLSPGAYRGTPALLDVVAVACRSDRAGRFGTVAEFRAAWQGVPGTARTRRPRTR